MYRTDQPTAVTALPVPAPAGTPGFFTGGNPATGQAATIVDADFLNMIQEELISILTAASISPNKTAYGQVLASLEKLFAAATGSSTQLFDVETAPANDNSNTAASTAWLWSNIQALMQAEIGAVASAMGFEVVLATNGYIKFPSFLGGWVVQWGSFTTSASGYSNWGFPRAFPSASLLTWATPQLSNNTPISIGINQPGATTALIPVAALSSSGAYSQIALSMLSIGK
ncbi:hypothetical protein [Burkholderia gladioli]|uniref:gp53-like domain-containing protein n=1 Tax=Burkholderia gladioli TaxID=28095 RepID=UPI001640C4EF|nr:hypothetical protein [Burkholderia gladioli]